MWQFIIGFGIGIYVGTFYNCKPTLDVIITNIKNSIPKEKK